VRKRAEHAQALIPQVRAALRAHSALEWEQRFGERVPCAAVRQIEDMFDHPQVQAEGLVQDFSHPLVGRYRGLSRAYLFGTAARALPQRAAPAFGQHSDEVLAGSGYSAQEITQLRAGRAVL
jgi:formyl-CoA transferase